MDYIPRINQAITDCVRDGYGDDREWMETAVRQTALNDDNMLYRQLEPYINGAIELAAMITEALNA
jgi:hypothetical protein